METHDLRKVHDEAEALEGLSQTVRQHSIFGCLGPDGASEPTTRWDRFHHHGRRAAGVYGRTRLRTGWPLRFCLTWPET